MPALDFTATTAPADLVAGVGLAAGTRFAGQNLSTTATLFIRDDAAAPAIGDRAFRAEAGSPFTVKNEGNPIWVWTDEPNGCPVILNEAP